MNKKFSTVKLITIISVTAVIFFTIISGVLFYLLLNDDFNNKIQHFSLETPYFIPYVSVIILSILISVIPAFIYGKKYRISKEIANISIPKTFASTLASLLIIIYSVYTFFFDSSSNTAGTLALLIFILGILSGIYFLIPVFSGKPKSSSTLVVTAFFAMAPVFWAIASMLACYFDKSLAVNSPLKSTMLLSYAGLIIYFTEDIRRYISTAKPSTEYFSKLVASAVVGGNAICRTAVCLIDNSKFSFSVFSSFLMLALWLLILSSLAAVPASIELSTEETPSGLSEKATPEADLNK